MNDIADVLRYEGAEKTLEVHFQAADRKIGTLRELPQQIWDDILDYARCQILSKTSGTSLDAYVLSESSLFIYDWKICLKTCGKTTLLKCLHPLFQVVEKNLGARADWFRYSRKNFCFPSDQIFPHNSFDEEVQFCLETCPLFLGTAHVFGDILSDHFNVFYAQRVENFKHPKLLLNPHKLSYFDKKLSNHNQETLINIMMYDMDRKVAEHFYLQQSETAEDAVTRATDESGISALLQSFNQVVLDPYMFSPCGYSLNAILQDDYYATIHITPEDNFSYASFETNFPVSSYQVLLQKVLNVFEPNKCIVTIFSDNLQAKEELRCFEKKPCFTRITYSSARISNVFFAEMSTFKRRDSDPTVSIS